MEGEAKFFVKDISDKYAVQHQSIGIDTETKNKYIRNVVATGGVPTITTDTITHIMGQQLTFDYTVSPGSVFSFNESTMRVKYLFGNTDGSATLTSVTAAFLNLQWNSLLRMFTELILQINGKDVYVKSAGEYYQTQTMRFLSEYNHDEAKHSNFLFGNIGDELYDNTFSTFAITGEVAPKSISRHDDWLVSCVGGNTYTREPTLKDVFFNLPGVSENIRTLKIIATLASPDSMHVMQHKADTDPSTYQDISQFITGLEFNMVEYVQSSTAAKQRLNEHLCYIDVGRQSKTLSDTITVNSKKNIQWVAATQFGNTVDLHGVAGGDVKNGSCSHFYLYNGYNNAALTANTVTTRADMLPTTAANHVMCPKSTQLEYVGIMYPPNAVRIRDDAGAGFINHSELYREYVKGVKSLGVTSPCVKEEYFKRTLPFIFLKPWDGIKQVEAAPIYLRLEGASVGTATSNNEISVFYGELKAFNITPSGACEEVLVSF